MNDETKKALEALVAAANAVVELVPKPYAERREDRFWHCSFSWNQNGMLHETSCDIGFAYAGTWRQAMKMAMEGRRIDPNDDSLVDVTITLRGR